MGLKTGGSHIMAAKTHSSLLLETTPVSTTHHILTPSSCLLRAPSQGSLSAPGTQRSWENSSCEEGETGVWGTNVYLPVTPLSLLCFSFCVCRCATPSSLLYSQNLAQCPEHSRCSVSEVQVARLCLTLCNPMDYTVWISPGQNTGVGSLSLRQWFFLTQGLNQGLLHCRWILYQLSYHGSPGAQ